MNKTNTPARPAHESTHEAITQLITSEEEDLRIQRAKILLTRRHLVEALGQRAPDEQVQVLDEIDKVCQPLPLYRNLWLNTSPKAYPTIDRETVKYVRILGRACSDIVQLPASVVISGKLDINGDIAVASGGLTDFWRGKLSDSTDGSLVAIKAFRTYPPTELNKVKRVSKKSTNEVHSRTKFADSLGTGTVVEETLPRQHPTIPRCRHEPLRPFPCI